MSNKKTEDNFIMEVASRFRAERLRLEMSQDDVASICGVTSRSILSWESGVKIPSHYLAQLAHYKFDVGFVLTGVKNEEKITELTMSQRKALKMAELFEALNEDQQKEILAAVKDKKRMNELVEIVNQLQKKVG